MELKTSSLSDLSDNQIKFLNSKKLSDDQVRIALAVDAEARRQGVNPEFVWPMVYQESKFQQDAKSPKGAIGVMQLMGDTAKGLKVDPTDVSQNISGGIALLKELMQNPKIGNDPYKVLAGYNASTETRNKFYESGDLADLKDETITHMLQVGKHYGGDLPSVSITPQAQSEPDKVAEEVAAPENENVYSGTPVTHYDQQSGYTPAEVGAMAGLTGAGLGSIYSAKAPALRVAQRVGLLPGGKPMSAQDAVNMAERIMTPEAAGARVATEAAPQAASKPPHGGGAWVKGLTGIAPPGAQMDKASLDLAKGMQSAVGIQGAPGFTGGTITEGGVILSPQEASAIRRDADLRQAANNRISGVNERLDQALARKAESARPNLQRAVQQHSPAEMAQKVAGSAPVRGGLAGLGVGYNVQDAYNKFDQGDMLSGGLSSAAAATSALSLAPKIASKMNPLAVGLTTASQVAGDLRRGDKQAAAESGLSGMAALLPRIFGPAGAVLYSGGLNKDEERELDRRRAMAPTISP